MSSILDILEDPIDEVDGSIYLKCRPITTAAPRDKPEIKQVLDDSWSAKILIVTDSSVAEISDWFSVSYKTLCLSTGTRVSGEVAINVQQLPQHAQKRLFYNTNPVFSIGEDESYNPINR